MFLYLCWVTHVCKKIIQRSKLDYTLKKAFYSQVKLIIITGNYVRIMVIYHLFNEYGFPIDNIRNSMLDLHN